MRRQVTLGPRCVFAAWLAVFLSHAASTAFGQFVDKSALPDVAELLRPQQVADLTSFLLSQRTPPPAAPINAPIPTNSANATKASKTDTATTAPSPTPTGMNFGVEEQKDRLRITLSGLPIVDFVFRDDKILRPYFANARLADGRQITRNHPPVNGADATDHDTMHPGIWLGFGDISRQDFWRNKAKMEHLRFVTAPTATEGRLRFTTECRLQTAASEPLCLLTNDYTLLARPNGWLLIWTATFRAERRPVVFGDQEEMGFGARVATGFTEKNGGLLVSSTGKKTAKETWGQPAAWCDYSGRGARSGGVMLMPSPGNFRESWWHNRDYGVFVANPFGREAMKQGPRSAITIAPGESMKITFGALIHDDREFDRAAEYAVFREAVGK